MKKVQVTNSGKTYVTEGPTAKFYTEDVEAMRNRLQIGERVLAEVYMPRKTGADKETVLFVEILAKYPHVAITDRGTVSWVNILLHNPSILRKIRENKTS